MAREEDVSFRSFSAAINNIAKANRFLVKIEGRDTFEDMKFFITKATIPQIDITGPEINYFGTKIMLSGDPKFEPLTIGFLNGTYKNDKWKIRDYFEDWAAEITNYRGIINKHGNGKLDYRLGATITIEHLGDGYDVIAEYKYHNVVPLNISSIELDMSSENSTESFDVTFYYTYAGRG